MHLQRNLRSLASFFKKTGIDIGKANIYTILPTPEAYPKHVRVIDYRSDTFSLPSPEMRKVMYEAQVGDDVYREDPTVNALEQRSAQMLGKEDALFVASGTMSNLLAIMTHCPTRGSEIITGDESHILLWEQAGAAQVAGVQLRTVTNRNDGTFDLNEMMSRIRNNKNFNYLPSTQLVCVENTHNTCGGRSTPLKWLRELAEVLKPIEIPLHMDGARFFNSVVSTGVPANEMVRDFDSVSVCLSKGLGAPMGSVLVGSSEFIARARHSRKVLGGGMRQVGHMAAAGLYALENMVERLREDHEHAKRLAKAIHDMGSKIVTVVPEEVETNILLINLDTTKVNSQQFCLRMAQVTKDELKQETAAAVKTLPWSPGIVRCVVCCNNNDEDLEATVKKLQRVIWEYDNGKQP